MKKLITIFLAIVLVMSMAACNNDTPSTEANPSVTTGDNETNVTEDTNENTSATEETTASDPTTNTETTDPTQNTGEGGSPTDRDDKDETTPTTGTETTEPTIGTTPNETVTPSHGNDATEPTHTHEYTDKVTAATCTKDGYTTHTCACGNSYTDSKTSAMGHSFGEWKTTKEPTTTATGIAERKCSKCSEIETKTLGKLAENHKHNYTAKVTKAATCSAEGVKTYTCSCGDKYTESIAKTAHKYTDTVVKPTCTNDGYTTHKCSCGDAYSDSKTNKLGHAYNNEVVKPTCSADGYTKHTCSRCGTSYTDSKTSATGHSYSVTSDTATCTANGTKTETCAKCGNKKTSASQATGHGSTRTETKDATTKSEGYVKTICNTCGTVISTETIPKLECTHNYVTVNCSELSNDMYYMKYQTYTDWVVKRCSECGEVDGQSFKFKYTQYEAAQIMLDYVNQLRYEVYGTHDYDLVLSDKLMQLAEVRAEMISEDFQHIGLPCGENICAAKPSIYAHFLAWKESSGHYANMINKDCKYFAYGIYAPQISKGYGVQLFSITDDMEITIN